MLRVRSREPSGLNDEIAGFELDRRILFDECSTLSRRVRLRRIRSDIEQLMSHMILPSKLDSARIANLSLLRS